MKENSERAGALCVIASAVLFGLMPLLAKIAYADGANASTAAFGRFLTGSAMAFAYLKYKGVPLRLGRRRMGEIAFLSVFYALTPVLLYLSYGFIGSGLATTLHFTYPVAVMCLMGLFFRARFTLRQVICAALCAAGIFLLYRPGRNADGFGMALAAASGLLYAGYIIALGLMLMKAAPGIAADTATGAGSGVAYGTGSNAPKAENVAVGKGATIKYSNGASNATGDVAVGSGAIIDNYASQGSSIAIGKNAKIENMTGKQESLFALGQTTYHSGNLLGTVQIPDNPENVAGSIAIGDNTYARTGSIMIGSHNYRGDIGDQSVDTSKTKDYGININATTLGTNSFNQGAFSTVSGAYSIISGKYNGSGFSSDVGQNFGATITGSLNSIESATASSKYSGIANSVVGTANRTFNSNGSLIFGAGNEITNSVTSLSGMPTSGGDSAKELADSLRAAVKSSDGGGATLAIGGGNTADWTQASQIIGVNNTLTGTDENNISKYNLLDGYKNTAKNVNHVTVIGSENTAENTDTALLLGDRRKLTGANYSVVLGSADAEKELKVADAVLIGHNADVQKEGGVALGSGSVASVDKGVVGYTILPLGRTTPTIRPAYGNPPPQPFPSAR